MTNNNNAHALRTVLVLLAGLVASLVLAGSASAAFGVAEFDGTVSDADGNPYSHAGGHPFDVTTTITFNQHEGPYGQTPDADVKDISVDLPPGLIGNPQSVAACSRGAFADNRFGCPGSTQIGMIELGLDGGGGLFPVWNLEPRAGQPAVFGFSLVGVPTAIVARVRSDGDYGLSVDIPRISQVLPVKTAKLTLWGVPGDPRHDAERVCKDEQQFFVPCGPQPQTPLFTLPTSCPPAGTGLTTGLSVDSWQQPDVFATASFVSHDNATPPNPLGPTRCDEVPFTPTVSVTPRSTAPDAPSGYGIDIRVPSDGLLDPAGIAQANLRDAVVSLPVGTSISPSAANGLGACSDEQLGLRSLAAESCPDNAKIGTVSIDTPLLAAPLTGSVYLGTQKADDPYRMFIVAAGSGIRIKLRGSVHADASTGQLTTTFRDNPQLPFTDLHLELDGGPRAPLANPASCGSKDATSELTPWSGNAAAHPGATFAIDCAPGLGGFSPTFSAGSANPVGGASAPFDLTITKPGGDSSLTGLSMVLPPGLLAHLKGNLNTQVGTVKAYAGSGSNPYMLPGQVFLEGPYGDAPFSLRVVVPAKAGPLDLGTVEVRQKIYIDPIDAHVTVVSDPLPTMVAGVPVRLQRLDVTVDKPGFMVNPTDCDAKTIGATLSSAASQSVPIGVHFQVGGCADLQLKPRLTLTLAGKGETTDGDHPRLSASLIQPDGGVNLKKAQVSLPLSLALDPDNAASDGLCSFAVGSQPDPACPASSIVGTATAVTPLLDEPLTGPVYFVKNERTVAGRQVRTLPKLVIPLKGGGVSLTLTGTSAVVDERLVTTFDALPDAPVSSFQLDINGGPKGILVVSGDKADICAANQIADRQLDGQNRRRDLGAVQVRTPDCALKVISKKVTPKAVTLKVGGLGAGKLSATGKGIKKTTRTISRSTVATIVAKRTKGAPGRVSVSFDPEGPAKARTVKK